MGRFDFIPGTKDYRERLKEHPTKKYGSRTLDKITHLAVHHSLTKTGSAESFAKYHVNTNNWPGIGYHFVIEKDGTVKWCHDPEVRSYHVGKSNGKAVGICVVGDFRSQRLEDIQLKPLLALLKFLQRELSIPNENVWGHSEFPGYDWKACPCVDMKVIRMRLGIKQEPAPEIVAAEADPEFIGPPRKPRFDISSWLDPNFLTSHPGESIIEAVSKFSKNDLGEIKTRNKQVNLKEKKKIPQVVKTDGPPERVPKKVQSLIDAMKSKNYAVFTNDSKPFNINIVGVRNESSVPNSFDDRIYVFWKFENSWKIVDYKATTDPGLTYLRNPINDDGTAILLEGQYRGAYSIGKHRKKYEALVQTGEVTVIRDFDRDSTLDFDSARRQTGLFGINIHHASYTGTSTQVDKWSAGCQVIANINDFNDFMGICRNARNNWGENFTYTLLNQRQLA